MKKGSKIFAILVTSFIFGFATVNAEVVEVKDETGLTTCVSTSGNTCKLTENIALSGKLSITADVIIDLNGKSITPNATLSLRSGLIDVKRSAKLTVNDTVGTGKISTGNSSKVWGGIQLVNLYDKDETKTAELVINGGTIEGYYYAIVGNGTLHNTKITINNGTIKGLNNDDSLGIYHPQEGTLKINGGTITGGTGIEIRSGSLIMNGGTIKGVYVPTSVLPNGNGSTTNGAGIAVAQHTTKKAINVTINGGKVEGYTALYESNPQKNPAEAIEKVSLKVAGGVFNAINGGTNAVYSEDFTKFITGGTFSNDVESYVKDGFEIRKASDSSFVVEKIEIKADIPVIDKTETPKETTIGVSDYNKISNVLLNTLAESSELQAAINGISVTTSLDIKSVTTTKSDVDKVKKALTDKKISNAKISDFFDITVNVKNAHTGAVLGTLSELTDSIELVVALPEDLLDVKDGYTRTYYIIRNHNGVLDVLDTVISKDKKSVSFTSDKFSTYAIAYVDTPAKTLSIVKNPETGDNIMLYIILGLVSICGAGFILKFKKANQ